MPTIGEHIGPFELLAPIGAGGMGEVWKARDTRLGRTVAIKWLKGQHSSRFQQEARAIAALNHPNICQIYDVGPDYLVMEFIEGSPLSGPLSAQDSVAIALQIAGALEEAHSKSILHRDLKPSNVMRTTKGSAKLLDFGLAKLMANEDPNATQTMEGTIAGTAAFMSPEQAQAKPLDQRSDIFSFGALLYSLLSGRAPFRGNSLLETLSSVLRDEPAPLDAPESVEAIVRKCMAKRAEERYASATDVRAALENALTRSMEKAPSIAVLPFTNLSGDKEQEYFSDGLAEEIINALVKIPGLRVIARASAFAFRGQTADVRKIADTLGVANILEGSVRRAGNRVRVTVQLISTADATNLWSERYDRELADIFEVQDEISSAISEALQGKLAPKQAARYTPKMEAYEALLKARHHHWQMTPESIEQAGVYYRKAIELDSNYALAHAWYADYWFLRSTVGLSSLREIEPKSSALIKRALELEPTNALAEILVCSFAATHDYDWAEAARWYSRASANPETPPHGLMALGVLYLHAIGKRPEAIEEAERGVRKDPLQTTCRTMLGHILAGAGRFEDAERQLREALAIDPHFYWAHYYLAQALAAQHRFDEALAAGESAFTYGPMDPAAAGLYAGLLARAGDPRAQEIVKGLGVGDAYAAPTGFGLFFTVQDDLDQAADWWAKAIEQRHSMVVLTLQGALCEPLRNSPHWPRLRTLLQLPA